MNESAYAVFDGPRLVAEGALAAILPHLKQRFDDDRNHVLLVFEEATGKQVEFDLRGSLADVQARYAPARGPGRPRLGVVSREVTLLPAHWEWLEGQASGASGALRRLVDGAMKAEPAAARAPRMRAALSNFLTAMAGDRPNYEEACRALFAGELAQFERLIQRWPKDIQRYALRQARGV